MLKNKIKFGLERRGRSTVAGSKILSATGSGTRYRRMHIRPLNSKALEGDLVLLTYNTQSLFRKSTFTDFKNKKAECF